MAQKLRNPVKRKDSTALGMTGIIIGLYYLLYVTVKGAGKHTYFHCFITLTGQKVVSKLLELAPHLLIGVDWTS